MSDDDKPTHSPGRFGRLFSSVQSKVTAVATSFSSSPPVTGKNSPSLSPNKAADNSATKPKYSCDWAVEECMLNTIPPLKCQREECDEDVHHLCQNTWQEKHGCLEESCSWYCRRHNKFYQEYLMGTGNVDAIDFTGGDGLQLLGDGDDSTSLMPPLPELNNNNEDMEKMPIGRPSKKLRAPTSFLSTTTRKGKKRQEKCVVGARVSIPCKLLKTHIDFDSDTFKCIEGLSNNLLLYGTVTGSKLQGSFTVEFDRLPSNEAIVVLRTHITTVDKNAEEPEYGHVKTVEATTTINGSNENEWEDASDDEMLTESSSRKTTRKKNPWTESQDNFISLPDDIRANSKTFEHFYGTKPEEKIVWKILSDDEQITQDAMDMQIDEIYNPVKVDIPWSPVLRDVDYNFIFFEHFFPSLEGKAKLIDEYLWDCRCLMYATVVNDKISFMILSRMIPTASSACV